jgi:hypothetical protein
MSDIQSKVLDLRRRIAEEKIKWGFTEDYQLPPEKPKQEAVNPPIKEISEADDLKAKLLNRKKIK